MIISHGTQRDAQQIGRAPLVAHCCRSKIPGVSCRIRRIARRAAVAGPRLVTAMMGHSDGHSDQNLSHHRLWPRCHGLIGDTVGAGMRMASKCECRRQRPALSPRFHHYMTPGYAHTCGDQKDSCDRLTLSNVNYKTLGRDNLLSDGSQVG